MTPHSPRHAPYHTPPQSFRHRLPGSAAADTSPGSTARAASTSPSSLIRILYGLRSRLERSVLNGSVMIASDPTHAKHGRLRRIVRSFIQDDDEALATFVDVLVREPGATA